MKKLLIAASTVIGCALVFAGSIDVNRAPSSSGIANLLELTTSKAYAARGRALRTTRRVARRTTRRVIRRHTLPGSCVWRAPYHYCGGVYYEPVVESGTTIYIVIYP
jgi:hypothetical protein